MDPLPLKTKAGLNQCLLCHEPPCTAVCTRFDPGRILRALRFDNRPLAASLLPSGNPCASCAAPCVEACPLALQLPELFQSLAGDAPRPAANPGKADLSCDICGVKLENPFLLSSSVVSSSYEMCARAFEAGWAGAAFKTICFMEMHEASPRFSALKGPDGNFLGFKNIEELSERSVEENLEIFSRLKKDYPDKVLIASIMGRNEDEWESLARDAGEAGADVIECNFSCPNMALGGTGSDVGQDSAAVALCTAAARKGTAKPLLVKLTPNVADMRPMARAAARQSADGFALINTVKSFTGVDLESLVPEPAVNGLSCAGGYSGAAVKPIALRFLADLACDEALSGLHLSGMGGIQTWRDAAEFLLLGAGSIQVTTAVMEYGIRIIDDLLSGLQSCMARKGFQHVSEMIGLSAKKVVPASALERDTIVYPRFNTGKCIGCGRCHISCRDGGHQAIRFDTSTRKPVFDGKKCAGCHLCVLVCPTSAISMAMNRIRK